MAGTIRVKNRLNQMLPVVTVDPKTKQQIQSMIPAKGFRDFVAEQISTHMKALARKGTIEIIEM
jgi:hypothetical protein